MHLRKLAFNVIAICIATVTFAMIIIQPDDRELYDDEIASISQHTRSIAFPILCIAVALTLICLMYLNFDHHKNQNKKAP